MKIMTKTSTIFLLSATVLALVSAPSAFAAGKAAYEYMLGTYIVMLVQADGLRLGCF